jgi:hypothetical protein
MTNAIRKFYLPLLLIQSTSFGREVFVIHLVNLNED